MVGGVGTGSANSGGGALGARGGVAVGLGPEVVKTKVEVRQDVD